MFDVFAAWPVTLAQENQDTSPPPTADAPANPGTTEPADGTTPGNESVPPPGGGLGGLFLPLILVFAVLLIFSMGGGRKEKKRRAEMLSKLSKGSKVQTVGGVLGTVVDVRDDEVVVKVDENSNTRMRFAKTAINSVTSDE
jgi:preprotein translocase subunit YajC